MSREAIKFACESEIGSLSSAYRIWGRLEPVMVFCVVWSDAVSFEDRVLPRVVQEFSNIFQKIEQCMCKDLEILGKFEPSLRSNYYGLDDVDIAEKVCRSFGQSLVRLSYTEKGHFAILRI